MESVFHLTSADDFTIDSNGMRCRSCDEVVKETSLAVHDHVQSKHVMWEVNIMLCEAICRTIREAREAARAPFSLLDRELQRLRAELLWNKAEQTSGRKCGATDETQSQDFRGLVKPRDVPRDPPKPNAFIDLRGVVTRTDVVHQAASTEERLLDPEEALGDTQKHIRDNGRFGSYPTTNLGCDDGLDE